MSLFNLTNTLKNKFKAFISIGRADNTVYQTPFWCEDNDVFSLPKNLIDVIHKTPLTKNNFNLICKSVSEEGGGDMWSCRALGLLMVAYPAFIYTQNTSNKPITMSLFLQFIMPDQLVLRMFSNEGKSTFGAYAKPIADLRGFMFDLPGFDLDFEEFLDYRKVTPVVRDQLGYLVMRIEPIIVCLTKNDLWKDK